MAEGIIVELQEILQSDAPQAHPVRDRLLMLSESIKEGGPELREKMINAGAYQLIVKAWSLLCYSGISTVKLFTPDALIIRDASLEALYSLTAGFPDIIEENGWTILQQSIDNRMPTETLILSMKLIRNVCIKSEENREHITWDLGVLDPLISLIKSSNPSPEFVQEWCGAMKTLILSDDTRVAYNRAPERKRMIHSNQVLSILSQHLQTYEEDEETLNAIAIFLGSMAVNADMCIAIESGNVFPPIMKIFKTYPQNRMLVKNTLSLLRYLNVSQSVREKCAGYGIVKWVLQMMLQHKTHDETIEVGMSCLAFMTLKNACQAAQVVATGGISIIITFMKQYLEDMPILKGASLTLRNCAASGGIKAQTKILESGGEEILRQCQFQFPDLREHYIKPCLKDLGVLTNEESTAFARISDTIRTDPVEPSDHVEPHINEEEEDVEEDYLE